MSIARYPHGFSLTGPPRHVPLSVRSRLLFGGFCSQLGWFCFGFGMIFFWIFANQGMRTALFGPLVTFVVVFPVVGVCFILTGMRRGRKAIRLLKHGRQTAGKLVSKKSTGASVNDRPVYKMTFQFTADDGRNYQAVATTHLAELLTDDASEPLVYDPWTPASATLLDHLPGSPRLDEAGVIRNDGTGKGLLVAILPTVSIVGHGLYACLRYLEPAQPLREWLQTTLGR